MRSLHSLFILNLVLAACGGPQKKDPPRLPSQPVPQAAAPKKTEARQLAKETTLKSPSGATFTVAAGWYVTDHPGYQLLEDPDRQLILALVEPEAAGSGERAIAEAWKRVKPDFARAVKQQASPPPKSPWDAFTRIIYETTTKERRVVLATARRKGKRWYVVLLDGKQAAVDRRGANVTTLVDSFKAPGAEEESWVGRKAHPLEGKRLADFVAFVEQARKQTKIPGVALAVVQNGKVVLEKGFGVRALGKRAPVTPRTLFMIGSTTKSLTSLMMARLVDMKRFDWDTPVTKLMPTFALGDAKATQKLAMKHTVCACTGLPRQDMEFIFEYEGITPEQRIALMKTMKPTTGFGETFQYSNSLVSAGGYIAARAYRPKLKLGPAYAAAMRDLVFRPLGMRYSTLSIARAKRSEHAAPHGMNLKLEVIPTKFSDERIVVSVLPAGAAWSCVKDMERYLLLELAKGVGPRGKRLLSEANLLKRREPMAKISNKMHYGLGLMVKKVHGVEVVQHGGDTAGYQSDMFFLPAHNVGVSVLNNAQAGGSFRKAVQRRLLELLFDGEERAETRLAFALKHREEVIKKELRQITFEPEPAWLRPLLGTYKNPGLGQLTLGLKGKRGVLDVGEWRSSVGQKKEKDGTLKLLLLDPPWAGLEFLPRKAKSGTELVLEIGQHRYVFKPQR